VKKMKGFVRRYGIAIVLISVAALIVSSASAEDREEKRKKDLEKLQEKFSWWPTDAQPAPVRDPARGGYWWMPKEPGTQKHLWGNRGYIYVYKIIFDYKEEELPAPKPAEQRPSLLIRKIIKNVKVYFDFDKADIRDDATPILKDAVRALEKNPSSTILITGNCDIRGSEKYNEKLGRRRGEAVKQFMLNNGIPEDRIRIVSRGKLDAVAPVTDLVGMQKDRNAQFMVAEVEEVMMAYAGKPPEDVKVIEEGKYLEEKEEVVEGAVKVSTKEYTIKEGDSLWKIAEKEMGSGHRWKYLYDMNRDVIRNPKKLKAGVRIVIPVE
jgi:outer membrane protein OmpA-like peptidoglycan-associated protein